MSSVTIITLDTTAPVVEFGAAGGTTAGEHFQIAYTSNEPLAWATLISASGQRLALDGGSPGVLSVQLPPDVADGWATIEWADDVGNEASAVAVRLVGAVVQPPPVSPPSPGGFPRPDKRPMVRRRLTARSTIVVSSRTRRTETSRTRQRRTGIEIVTSTRQRTRQVGEVHIALSASSRRWAAAHWVGAPITVNSTTTIRRRDDPTTEAYLLDLL